jgi:surface protein
MKNQLKEKNGITLIALVITIIVLLILAGVTIATLTGDNGLLTKAGNAKNANENANLEEKIKLAYLEYELESRTNPDANIETITKDSLEKAFNESITTEKIGNSLKITFNNRNKNYKYLANGNIIELLDPTDIYGKLDEDGTVYLRSTKITDDYIKLYGNRVDNAFPNSRTDIKKVIIEEPIAPSGGCWRMFYYFSNLETIEGMEKFHTENLTSISEMFVGCSSLRNLDVSRFDTSKVTDMGGMFHSCSLLTSIDVTSFDTNQVQTMNMMFSSTSISEIDLSNFDTGNVNTTFGMFVGCSKLVKLDLSSFNTINITNMNRMLQDCKNLKELNLGKKFTINENTSYDTYFISNVPNTIKIKATRATKAKIVEQYPNLINNFELLD